MPQKTEEIDRLASELAARLGINKTEAVKRALENELRLLKERLPLRERLRPLQERVHAYPATGQDADKDFFDWLSGDD